MTDMHERLVQVFYRSQGWKGDAPELRRKANAAIQMLLNELSEPDEYMRMIMAEYLGLHPNEARDQGLAVRIAMWRPILNTIRPARGDPWRKGGRSPAVSEKDT